MEPADMHVKDLWAAQRAMSLSGHQANCLQHTAANHREHHIMDENGPAYTQPLQC